MPYFRCFQVPVCGLKWYWKQSSKLSVNEDVFREFANCLVSNYVNESLSSVKFIAKSNRPNGQKKIKERKGKERKEKRREKRGGEGKGREGKRREGKGREGKEREEKRREGKGRKEKRREGKGREGKKREEKRTKV